MLQSGWLINNTHLFLIVLKAGKPKIKVKAWSCFGEGPLPGLADNLSLCPPTVEGLGISVGTLS